MEHVVFYPSADGSPAFRRVSSLDEAVNFVEHLRNIEGVTDFSVHALTAVPLNFRAYYHVEVPPGEVAPAYVEAPAPVISAVPTAPAEAVVVGAPVAADPFPEAPAPVAVPEPAVSAEPVLEAEPVAEPAAVIVEQPSGPPAEAVPAEVVEPQVAEVAPEAQPVVDPSVEEVVPAASGRRSMGFFARS
jgi:hypothetical protein